MEQKKQIVKCKVIQPKKRISASINTWMIEETEEWASKEERSFSNMVERLLWEALQTRKGLVSKSKK
jgi:hypothetical protein